jgi:peroxiredoxin
VSPRPGSNDPDEPPAGGDREPEQLTRLDPDLPLAPAPPAGATPASPGAAPPEPEIIDTRRYRWMIGIFGLALLLIVSIYQFATHGTGSIGVPAGQRLHLFAAPLANTSLTGDPNLAPPCTLAHHDPRALNICLLVKRAPLVLTFFVTGSPECERQVDALQTLSSRFPRSEVSFAAVAVSASRRVTESLIRSHHWTIPVAYDRSGALGSVYGVAICPLTELANRGGVVARRLVGDPWSLPSSLISPVRALVQANRSQ